MTDDDAKLVWRGRIYYFILAAWLLGSAAVTLVRHFQDPASPWWWNLGWPAFVTTFTIGVWRGDVWFRRALAFACVAKGAESLLFVMTLAIGFAKRTPPDQIVAFFAISLYLLWLPALVGGIYVWIGLALEFSKSLEAFFFHQIMQQLAARFRGSNSSSK